MRRFHLGLAVLLSVCGCGADGGDDGVLAASNRAALGTPLSGGTLGDFDGDGHTDVLFRVTAAGGVAFWRMNGATILETKVISLAVPNDWQIVGSGRINHDTTSDILWRNVVTGDLTVWFMYASAPPSMQTIWSGVDPTWRIQGVGDFDGDTYDDLLWMNKTTGQVATWLLDGTTVRAMSILTPPSPALAAGSEIVGVGDFDGDRREDILWRSPSGSDVTTWSLDGGTVKSSNVIQAGIAPSWRVRGVADFDKDQRADILWRNVDTGDVAMSREVPFDLRTWQWVFSSVWTGVPSEWEIDGAGDFDGDLRADIFWRNARTSDVGIWIMNASTPTSMPAVAGGVPSGWKPASAVPGQSTPTLSVSFVAMQPGWVRGTVRWNAFVNAPHPSLSVTCASPTSDSSLTITMSKLDVAGQMATFDLRVNEAWLFDHDDPLPCHVTGAQVSLDFGTGVASHSRAIDFQTDVPLFRRDPSQLGVLPSTTAVDLIVPASARRHAAYPPRTFVVLTASGYASFLEVEELASRKTLGVRALMTKAGHTRVLDFNAGAEVFDGWGIDVERRGVTRPTSGLEEWNPAVKKFGTTLWTKDLLASGAKILPAPPLYTEAEQASSTLDNHGIPRQLTTLDELDVQYDLATHRLLAINGARIGALDLGGPLDASASTSIGALTTSTGAPAPVLAAITNEVPRHAAGAAPSCALPATPRTPATRKLSTCFGYTYSLSSFVCPSTVDPIKPESFPSTPGVGGELLIGTSPSLNSKGSTNTCGSSSFIDTYEALLNRYVADMAPIRSIPVDGQSVVVAEPRVGLSVSGSLWNLYRWVGTKDDFDTDPTSVHGDSEWPEDMGTSLPQFADGYWPARLIYSAEWHAAARPWNPAVLQQICENPDGSINNFKSGFCMGSGGPPPGVYRNYSQMVSGRALDPVRDGAWSVVNTAHQLVFANLDLTNIDVGMRAMILELQNGMPLRMGFSLWDTKNFIDADGSSYSQYNPLGGGWFLPPEIAGCSPERIAAELGARGGGHSAVIAGYSIAGSMTAPDPVNSYFIIKNNWGFGGETRNEFQAMSFAYFRYMVSQGGVGVQTARLDRRCASSACATH